MFFALVIILDAKVPSFRPEVLYIGALVADLFITLPVVFAIFGG